MIGRSRPGRRDDEKGFRVFLQDAVVRRLWIAAVCLATISVSCSGTTDSATQQIVDADDGAVAIDLPEEQAGGSSNLGNGAVPKNLPMPVARGGEVVLSTVLTDQVSVHLWYDLDRWDELVTMYEDWLADQTVEDMLERRTETNVSWSGYIDGDLFSISVVQGPHPTAGTATSVILGWVTG